MDCEISLLEHTGTWTTILRPHRKNVVRCKWVFRLKRKADGSIDKYKACLVVRGFTQIYSIDYYDTYSLLHMDSGMSLTACCGNCGCYYMDMGLLGLRVAILGTL